MTKTYITREIIISHHKIQVSSFYCCSIGSTAHPKATCRNPPFKENGCILPIRVGRGEDSTGSTLREIVQQAPALFTPFLYCKCISPHSKNRSVQSEIFNFYSCLQMEFIVMLERSVEFIICL